MVSMHRTAAARAMLLLWGMDSVKVRDDFGAILGQSCGAGVSLAHP